MKPLTIQNGFTTFRFSRAQCASLSRACWVASQEGLDPDLDHWRTLAALFSSIESSYATAPPSPEPHALPAIPPPILCLEPAYISRQNEMITLELSARQCASLAKACWFAAQRNPGQDGEGWSTLAGLFQACAIAGLAQWQMRSRDIEALEADLKGLGL